MLCPKYNQYVSIWIVLYNFTNIINYIFISFVPNNALCFRIKLLLKFLFSFDNAV